MRILAVDPGDTCGIASFDSDRDPQHKAGQLPWHEAMDVLTEQIWTAQYDRVICERYTVSGGTLKKSREYTPLEGIGVLRWACYRQGIPFELSNPADAMRFASNDVLKKIGWYSVGKEHARDATRHLALECARLGLIDRRALLV